MYKIEIEWGFMSPHLRVLTGQVNIGNINFGMLNTEENISFPVKKELNTLGYKNCPAIFTSCKPLVDVMVRSYFDGLIMRDLSVEWFQNSYRINNEIILTMND